MGFAVSHACSQLHSSRIRIVRGASAGTLNQARALYGGRWRMIHTNLKRPMVPTSHLIVPNANIRRVEHGL